MDFICLDSVFDHNIDVNEDDTLSISPHIYNRVPCVYGWVIFMNFKMNLI